MKDSLAQVYARSHPAKAAARLGSYETSEVLEFLTSLDATSEAAVVARLGSAKAVSVLNAMAPQKIASLIEKANHADSLAIISYLRPARYPELVESAKNSKQLKQRLYGYSAKSVGAIASPDFISIEKGKLVSAARNEFDAIAVDQDLPVFVVQDNKLLGRLPVMLLLLKKNSDLPVEELMVESEVLSDRAATSSVIDPGLWSDYQVLPVVDKSERLIGVVSRQQLSAVNQETVEANVGIEEITKELASSYIMVCSHLLDALVGVRK